MHHLYSTLQNDDAGDALVGHDVEEAANPQPASKSKESKGRRRGDTDSDTDTDSDGYSDGYSNATGDPAMDNLMVSGGPAPVKRSWAMRAYARVCYCSPLGAMILLVAFFLWLVHKDRPLALAFLTVYVVHHAWCHLFHVFVFSWNGQVNRAEQPLPPFCLNAALKVP